MTMRHSWLALALVIAAIPTTITATPRRAAARPVSADARLKAIYTAEYAWRQKMQGPDENSPPGTPSHLPDVSNKAQAAKLARWFETARKLAAIRSVDLSASSKVDYAVYKGQIDALLAEQTYREYEKPLNSDTSFWGDVAEAARGRFQAEADYRAYMATLRELPRYFDAQIGHMRAGLKRGFTPAQVTLRGRDIGVAQVAEAKSLADNPLYAPFKTFPASIAVTTQAALRQDGEAAIAEAAVPAHAKLLAFLRAE
jgi:uncharacterized protein (DUF885 family)